jgi:hypothetical protein
MTTVAGVLASGASTTTVDYIAWIGVPVFLALCGAIFGIIKGSIRFAQYMAHSEEAQDSIAGTNTQIRDQLNAFVDKTNQHLSQHDQEIAVLRFAVDGQRPHHMIRTPADPGPSQDD